MKTMKTLAIDPAKASGIALWDGDGLAWSGEIILPYIDVAGRLRFLDRLLKGGGGRTASAISMVVEGQFLGVNPQSMMRTVEAAVCWQCAGLGRGFAVREKRILPQTWRSTFAIRGSSSAAKTAAAVAIVRDRILSPGDVPGDNQAEAILLGLSHHVSRLIRAGVPLGRLEWVPKVRSER